MLPDRHVPRQLTEPLSAVALVRYPPEKITSPVALLPAIRIFQVDAVCSPPATQPFVPHDACHTMLVLGVQIRLPISKLIGLTRSCHRWTYQPAELIPADSHIRGGSESVTSFCTGSSAPSARPGGTPRCGRRWRAVLAHPTRSKGADIEGARFRQETSAIHFDRRAGQGEISTHRRAADPIPEGLHAGARHQGRRASLRDGLRPPLTPNTAEQGGWLSDRWFSWPGTNAGTNGPSEGSNNHDQLEPSSGVNRVLGQRAAKPTRSPLVVGSSPTGPTGYA